MLAAYIAPHLLSQWTTEEEVDMHSLSFKLAIRVLRSNHNIHKLGLATPLRSKEPIVESIVNYKFISTQKPGALFKQQLDGLSILVRFQHNNHVDTYIWVVCGLNVDQKTNTKKTYAQKR